PPLTSALDQEVGLPGSSTCVCKNPSEIDRRRFDRDQLVRPRRLDPSVMFPAFDRAGQAHAGTDRIDGIGQVSPPAKISFLMTAWTPQFPSTTWVMPKSTPTVLKEIASSSVSFLVVIRNLRILRNASRKARSTDDFEQISDCALSP